ncbi:MAG: DUF7009 family protein [Bryobacteraceae bacterium]
MKLRFRRNSLRLRVNQLEVRSLANGTAVTEEVLFPGNVRMTYALQPSREDSPQANYDSGNISVCAPEHLVRDWAEGNGIGLYFELPAGNSVLSVAIEKDLECIDGPEEEKDPDAFPRTAEKAC